MARRCELTDKGVLVGNNVSHAKNRTKRRFLPNLQKVTFFSETLQQSFKFRVCTNAIRTVEHNGGFDQFLLKRSNTKLPDAAKKVKVAVIKAQKAAEPAADLNSYETPCPAQVGIHGDAR